MIVLDLSISVENGTLNRMYTGLTQLASTHDRFGLVLFSSRAYEALPPNTPASELRPFARFFHGALPTRPSGAYQGLGEPPPNGNAFASQQRSSLVAYPSNPWACCFSFGTEISDGLKLAQTLVVQHGAGQRAVWLMSDLADDPADRAVVSEVARSYAHDGIALHVIGLDPKPADKKFFANLLGARGTMIVGKPSTSVRLTTKHGFPVALAIVGGVLALLLTVNELLSTPLRWGARAMRFRLAYVLVPLAIVVGVVALVLASDVRSWRDLFQRDALAYSAAPTSTVRLQASTALPHGVSKSLLGVGKNAEWLTALRKFQLAYQDTLGLNSLGRSDYLLLNQGEAALRKVTQDPDPVRASQAYNLLAVLTFREALPGTGTDPNLLQQSLTELQDAVRLDPTDEQAKENLELGLRVLIAVNKIQQGQAPGTQATKKKQGGFGGPPGEGY